MAAPSPASVAPSLQQAATFHHRSQSDSETPTIDGSPITVLTSSSDSVSCKTSSAVETKEETADLKGQNLPSPSDYLERSERKPITWGFFRVVATVVKIIFSFALVIALAVGYGLSIKVIDISVTSIGLYGTILVVDFIVQYSCAIANRWDVTRIVNKARKRTALNNADDVSAPTPYDGVINGGAEVSIAVVGYREDEQAWKECLRSLQRHRVAALWLLSEPRQVVRAESRKPAWTGLTASHP